jgi:hypothetical protein
MPWLTSAVTLRVAFEEIQTARIERPLVHPHELGSNF